MDSLKSCLEFKLLRPIAFRFVWGWLGIVFLSTFALRAVAQTPAPVAAQPPVVASAPAPVITYDHEAFDFGKIQFGQTVVHRFKISNTGNATLHIKEVKASCGCTSTLIGKMVLAPGESTEIEADYTPEGAEGPVRKGILVISDAPTHSKLTLRFRAYVLPNPPANPPAH
jgi:hypothetical protein